MKRITKTDGEKIAALRRENARLKRMVRRAEDFIAKEMADAEVEMFLYYEQRLETSMALERKAWATYCSLHYSGELHLTRH